MGDDWQSTYNNDAGPARDREKPRPRRICAGNTHASPNAIKACPRVLIHPGANAIQDSSVAKA